ncbi:MAG TPA: NAD-dependent epimerase/dehydratase family protein [Solirubrobacteraceae bacterium]|nr:NAD-dependent epimerase/dehydratase family protein [Solirubrobacteraceae bacterium]
MKAFVTGGTGFIGGRVVAKLRERGDEVVALVRSPERAEPLRALGCQLVAGDLGDAAGMREAMDGCDGVFHVAAVYKVGLPKSQRQALLDSNVQGTANALDAAVQAGVPRILYVSTGNVFGNTHGQVVDESYRRDLGEGFMSVYDEAKYRAHELALQRISQGAPIVIVQPGGVYGPGDHSELGNAIEMTRKGRLPMIPFAEMRMSFVYVDDVADGIILAFDRGQVGESYNLAGERATMRDLVQSTARLTGRREPRREMPTAFMRASAPLGPLIGPLLGFPPNFRELISVSDGVSYWMTDEKARTQLGFSPRGLEQGLRDTLAAQGQGQSAASR